MRQTPTQAILPPSHLPNNFPHSISPSQTASPSVAQYSAGLAHDARNMLAAMDIYCELLGGPGVLKADDRHLLDELRLLRDSSGKLLDRLLVEALKCLASSNQAGAREHSQSHTQIAAGADSLLHESVLRDSPAARGATPAGRLANHYEAFEDTRSGSQPARDSARQITSLAAELQSSLPMLSALAGPRVHVSLDVSSCPEGELFIPPVDLTRVLINLVRNAAEAMSIGGRILIAATTLAPSGDNVRAEAGSVVLSIEDNGPGIPLSLLDRIFDLQVSSASAEESSRPRLQFRPRGLGLRIVREFVEASGGSVRALRLPDRGSRFEIVLPMVTETVTKVGRAV